MGYVCKFCNRDFNHPANLKRHQEGNKCYGKGTHNGRFLCPHCPTLFARHDIMKRHVLNTHTNNNFYACGLCSLYFPTLNDLKTHREADHTFHTEFALVKSAHRKQSQLLRLYFTDNVTTVDEGFEFAGKQVRDLIVSNLAEKARFKINLIMGVEMYKTDEEGVCTALELFSFRSIGVTMTKFDSISTAISSAWEDIDRNIMEFLYQGMFGQFCTITDLNFFQTIPSFLLLGSGWKILRPFYVDAEVVEVNPLNGAAGGLHIACYARQRGIVPDMDSTTLKDDGYCFYAAVAAGVIGHNTLPDNLEAWYQSAADRFGPDVDVKKIAKIEDFWRREKNLPELNINVVYCDERQRVIPVRAGDRPLCEKQVVIMLSHTANVKTKETVSKLADKQEEDAGDVDLYDADNDEHDGVYTAGMIQKHYSLVLEPESLFARRQRSKGSDRIVSRKNYVCWNCLNIYSEPISLESHLKYCQTNACQKVIMPEEGDTMRYTPKDKRDGLAEGVDDEVVAGWRTRSFKSAYVLYFDFEALHVEPEKVCSCTPEMIERQKEHEERERKFMRCDEDELAEMAADQHMQEGEDVIAMEEELYNAKMRGGRKKCFYFPKAERSQKRCQHKTKVCAEQKAFSYSYYLMNRDGDVLENKAVVSEDAAECFIQDVLNIADSYLPSLSPGVSMREMSDYEKNLALSTNKCYICNEDFDETMHNLSRVLDHDHLNGDFLGVAHNICNLHRKEDFTLTCFSHNFSGYDSHFLVKVFGKMSEDIWKIQAIPLNTQKFKCLTLNDRIRFVDSAAFLNAPLADCAENLVKSDHHFLMLDELCDDEGQKQLLLRKGVYPYNFATSIEKLRETKELPPRASFYNDLLDKDVTDEDYEHAKRVWEAFDIKNMMEYTTLYLRTDTVLLAEAMTVLRDNMWHDFELDICKYLSLPMLAKDIMLKTTGAELELIWDQEMSDLIQKNLRGGLSFINKRRAEKRGGDEVLTEGDERSLLYTDCTNLYGKAMCMPLPLDGFEWMTEEEIANFSPETMITDKNGTGYFLEVDLEYPEDLHERHNSFPLAPESVCLTEADLSPYAYSCLGEINNKKKYKAQKLTSTFHPRTRYLCHGLNLQLYLRQGLRLVRIHRGIKFRQVDFIRPYIEMCSERRKTAKTEALRNMYKLLCNSLYGKLIEGFEKRMSCSFNRDRVTAMRHSSHPLFKGTVICDEDLSISFLKKPVVKMNQCWAVGFSVLELSKYWMQRMYYHDILPTFEEKGGCTVLMSDTDSLLLETATKSAEEAMELLLPIMDTSNYSPDHRLYTSRLAKVPGYMKNEVPKDEIRLFVGLKSKTYAIQTLASQVQMKAKGIPEKQKHKIPINEMLNCLLEMKKFSVSYHALRSVDHVNQLVKSSRVAFSSFDDKRYLLCEIHSVPYGSRLIKESLDQGCCYFCRRPGLLV